MASFRETIELYGEYIFVANGGNCWAVENFWRKRQGEGEMKSNCETSRKIRISRGLKTQCRCYVCDDAKLQFSLLIIFFFQFLFYRSGRYLSAYVYVCMREHGAENRYALQAPHKKNHHDDEERRKNKERISNVYLYCPNLPVLRVCLSV